MMEEEKSKSILSQKEIDEYRENLNKLYKRPKTESLILSVHDRLFEILLYQDTPIKHVVNTKASLFKPQDKLTFIIQGKYRAIDEIKDLPFAEIKKELVNKNGEQDIVLTSERYEVKKILKLLKKSEVQNIYFSNIPNEEFQVMLMSYQNQSNRTKEFIYQLKELVETELSSKLESSGHKIRLNKDDLLLHERELWNAIETRFFRSDKSKLNVSTSEHSINDEGSIIKSESIDIELLKSSGKLDSSEPNVKIKKENKPELHKPINYSIYLILKNQILLHESTKKCAHYEAEFKDYLKIKSEELNKITFKQILSEFKDLEKYREYSKTFLLTFQTQKYFFFIYSSKGIIQENSKVSSSEEKLDIEKSLEKQHGPGSGFLMVCSIEDREYKVFKNENNYCEIIVLNSNEIEVSNLLKISFDKGMHYTLINSGEKENDLIGFISQKETSNKILLIEYGIIGNTKGGFGFYEMTSLFEQLLNFKEIDLKSLEKEPEIKTLVEELSVQNKRTKEFLILFKDFIENLSDHYPDKIESLRKSLSSGEKIFLNVYEEKVLKKEEKKLGSSEMETSAQTRKNKFTDFSASTIKPPKGEVLSALEENMLELLKKEIKNYECENKSEIYEVEFKIEFSKESTKENNITYNEVRSEFKTILQSRENSQRFLLSFRTEKNYIFVYSTRGITEKENSEKKEEKLQLSEKKSEGGNGFFVVYSTGDEEYKVFRISGISETIVLDPNEIKLSGFLKVSFDKGMYFTQINSVSKEFDLIDYIKEQSKDDPSFEDLSISAFVCYRVLPKGVGISESEKQIESFKKASQSE